MGNEIVTHVSRLWFFEATSATAGGAHPDADTFVNDDALKDGRVIRQLLATQDRGRDRRRRLDLLLSE